MLATAGPANQGTLKELGAHVPIDYRSQDPFAIERHTSMLRAYHARAEAGSSHVDEKRSTMIAFTT